ncbi:MAG: LysM peptidoglycan-binding domain-containing protein [Chlamydiales bacterium]|nr:LysM peptidoglycan-binding domain-containing protein [Chlamydiales bacterium]
MSRRDTIIVAVLVNAALLMILFATAVRSDKKEIDPRKQPTQLAQAPKERTVEEDFFSTSVPTFAEPHDEPISFTEEIQLAYTPPQPIEEKKPVEKPRPHSNARYVDVTVKKGDFLEKIANANNTTVAAIMEANNISSTQLKIGQVLKVPLSDSKPKQPVKQNEGEFYVVKEGDNPWLIASRNNLRLDELLRLNGLDEQKARRLRPGDRLRIR